MITITFAMSLNTDQLQDLRELLTREAGPRTFPLSTEMEERRRHSSLNAVLRQLPVPRV